MSFAVSQKPIFCVNFLAFSRAKILERWHSGILADDARIEPLKREIQQDRKELMKEAFCLEKAARAAKPDKLWKASVS